MALKDYFEKAKDYFNLGDEDEQVPVARPQVAKVAPSASSASSSAQTQQAPRPQVVPQSAPRPEPRSSERKQSVRQNESATSTRQTTQAPRAVTSNIVPTIAIKEPQAYDNIMDSAQVVRNGESVLVNFKNMGDQQARRSIDFLTGVVFTLDGDIQNVGGQIFLLTPNGMTVDAEKELSILAGRNFEGMDNF
ncbi:cell division protein SepF [Lactococcus insecticola]|uniref:Cell division protein SepF n=1 Tax=Pseudolactococcus insecticola TaxID=2709158 RepID=A0A6A0B9C6_9LACT|nr:cell division protein SepF [Lactococcus insecticola]GFH41223.1 cell division protein SepF [Lactococcus insecticola]